MIAESGLRSSQLQGWIEQLHAIDAEAEALTAGLSDEQFNWRPRGDRWSMAQCFGHMNKVNGLLAPEIQAAVRDARSRDVEAVRVWTPSFIERKVLAVVGAGGKGKIKVPKPYEPNPTGSREAVMREFNDNHAILIECMQKADGLDLAKVKVVSPAAWFMRMSIGAWFAAAPEHDRYHLNQAKMVPRDTSFPAA